MYTWGSNSSGELGMGDFEPRNVPTLAKGLQSKTVSSISCGGSYGIALGKTIDPNRVPIAVKGSQVKSPGLYDQPEPRIEASTGNKSIVKENYYESSPKLEESGIRDELLSAITEEQEKRAQLERQVEQLELTQKQLTQKEVLMVSDSKTDSAQLKNRIELVEEQVEIERKKGYDIIKNIENLQIRNSEGINRKRTLEQKVLSLQREVEMLREENVRLRGERIPKKAADNSRLSELLKEYEEKIEREIQEKYKILREKQKEISELRDTIPKLKANINELENDKIKLEDYYKNEMRKLEEVLDEYNQKIFQEEETKSQLIDLHNKNSEKADELHRFLLETGQKKDNLSREIDDRKKDIEELNFQVLNKKAEIEQESKRHEDLLSIIEEKTHEINQLKEQCTSNETHYMEEINNLKRLINDKIYDNEDIENKINVKQIEIDTLNKDIVAWTQVANNVSTENDALKKIIEALEDKNSRLADSLNSQLESRAKESHERIVHSIKISKSPMKIQKILNANQNLQYIPESAPAHTSGTSSLITAQPGILETHGKLLKALETYGPEEEEEDQGRTLARDEKISDPDMQEREVLHDFDLTSPERSRGVDEPRSTNHLISKLGVSSPVRHTVAQESLKPAPGIANVNTSPLVPNKAASEVRSVRIYYNS